MGSTASAIVRTARQRAGMTQRRAAQISGLTQSVFSMYERGRRDPSLQTLRRLLDPLGFDVRITLVRRIGSGHQLSGPLGGLVRDRRDDIVQTLREHGAQRVWVVGRVALGHEEVDDGIVLHADILESEYVSARDALSELLGWDIPSDIHIAYPLRDGGILLPQLPHVELTEGEADEEAEGGRSGADSTRMSADSPSP